MGDENTKDKFQDEEIKKNIEESILALSTSTKEDDRILYLAFLVLNMASSNTNNIIEKTNEFMKKDYPNIKIPTREIIFIEVICFYCQHIDRLAFIHFGAQKRSIFNDAFWLKLFGIAKDIYKIDIQVLFREINLKLKVYSEIHDYWGCDDLGRINCLAVLTEEINKKMNFNMDEKDPISFIIPYIYTSNSIIASIQNMDLDNFLNNLNPENNFKSAD